MRKFMRKKISQIVFIFLVNIILCGIPTYADGERTAFGSESYQWELDEVSPIGIYAYSLQGITSTDIYVKYDATMLEYRSGGELVEQGSIRISATASGNQEFRQMLEFRPILAGNTQITIQESSIININGESHIAPSINAPIHIPLPSDCQLEEIQVNGVLIEGFTPTITEYELEVEPDVEHIEITTLPRNVQIEVSKNTLDVGNNEIHITTTNVSGQKGRYTLYVMRNEPAVTNDETQEPQIQDPQIQDPQVLMQGDNQGFTAKWNQVILYVILVILLATLVWLIIIKLRLSKKARKELAAKDDQSIRFIDWSDEETEKVIDVKNVTMSFRRDKDESSSIKEHFIKTITGKHSYDMFNALEDISFHINIGEVVGIIGTNGSGKSTILKIISGVLAPTKGSIQVNSDRVQLLTLGTGFDHELTGKENVYLNGAILGYTKEYIDEHYEDIVEFAELEGFMDEKVKNYSSGMVSRLGFAIATSRNAPEVLILDEVLSVGDLFFRKKSEKRIREMIQGGSTVLIVSHSTAVIKKNCTKVVWIEKGVLKKIGDAEHVCNAYEKRT